MGFKWQGVRSGIYVARGHFSLIPPGVAARRPRALESSLGPFSFRGQEFSAYFSVRNFRVSLRR